jgi:guanylate kinase
VTIFLLPPSAEALLARLRSRGSEGRAQRARRLQTALSELRAVEEFEYVLVNDRLEDTVSDIRSIIVAERHRGARRASEVRARRDRLLTELEGSEP